MVDRQTDSHKRKIVSRCTPRGLNPLNGLGGDGCKSFHNELERKNRRTNERMNDFDRTTFLRISLETYYLIMDLIGNILFHYGSHWKHIKTFQMLVCEQNL